MTATWSDVRPQIEYRRRSYRAYAVARRRARLLKRRGWFVEVSREMDRDRYMVTASRIKR